MEHAQMFKCSGAPFCEDLQYKTSLGVVMSFKSSFNICHDLLKKKKQSLKVMKLSETDVCEQSAGTGGGGKPCH